MSKESLTANDLRFIVQQIVRGIMYGDTISTLPKGAKETKARFEKQLRDIIKK